MKFEDIVVGKTYRPPNGAERKVVYKGKYYVLVEINDLGYPTSYQSNPFEKNPYENWIEVFPKIKVYGISYISKNSPKAGEILFETYDSDEFRNERVNTYRNNGYSCSIWETETDHPNEKS